MSTSFEKFIAKQELERRKIENAEFREKRIRKLSTQELEAIVAESDDEEAES
jgi:hypothetical protein